MNYGALFFLAGFLALASSWCGMVLVPQLQLGRQGFVTTADGSVYPPRRPGLAEQGAQVYRANGCVACHSQQVRQTGTVFDVVLTELGTNQPALTTALQVINSNLNAAALAPLPKELLRGGDKTAADAADKALKPSGAKYSIHIRPVGPDIDRGWGQRATVAQDYLQDAPVFLGAQRLGPDLANVGLRQPDANWHLLHLYAPSGNVAGSTMPPYRFLFEQRKIGRHPSPDALPLTGSLAPKPGYEIVPTEQAVALVAYLRSLRADAPLYEAPLSVK
jgi:cbb3-type cytochrome oxidase cytochrome c subunit